MSIEVLLTIGTTFVAIITAVLIGFIPWAYKINGRLTSIEVQIKHIKETEYDEFKLTLNRIEQTLNSIPFVKG